MFGPNKKMMMRKKAMDSMMKEGPSLKLKSRKDPMMDEETGIESEKETEGQEEGGFVSIMVTPEEKAMIMKMRGKSDEEESEDMSDMEA